MARVVVQVEDPVAHPSRGAIACDIDQTDGNLRHRSVGADDQIQGGAADNLYGLGQRFGLEDEAADVIHALIDRLIARHRVRAPFACGGA